MILYIIFIEPLLLRLEEVTSGVVLKGRLTNTPDSPLINGVAEEQESFVDDVEALCSTDEDFVKLDECVTKFEKVSGAILNRCHKSVVLGLGNWSKREVWPLNWIKR